MAIFPGTSGDDTIITTSGNDTVTGQAGNDWLVITFEFANFLTGTDSIDGGIGNDTLSLAGLSSNLVLDLRKTTTQSFFSSIDPSLVIGSVAITNVENLVGGSGNDRFTGTTAANTLRGVYGNDTLMGMEGNDLLIGGANNDRYYGGAGIDTASFQELDDALILNDRIAFLQVDLSNTGFQNTGEGLDRFSSIENLVGSKIDDFFKGNAGANSLRGLAGDDTLDGGLGQDTLTGDAGSDVFVMGIDGGTYTGTARGDLITDFTRGQDTIDVSDFSATNPDFGFLNIAQRISGSTTIVEISAGASNFYRMTLSGVYTLTEDDFLI
jgi:serralysin